jgi:Rps23 Pro-64 3,4-dihydroxylase Tpa1-like proline 4-hydroxylase
MNLNFNPDITQAKETWDNAKPFRHIVIDNFLPLELANKVADEFPNVDSDFWYEYANPLEIKKACSDWNKFSPSIYQLFIELFSPKSVEYLNYVTGKNLTPDVGLHGGGLHCHKSGGKLNTHLDYNIHPKVNLQRKVNIIVYVTKDWNPNWDGSLGLWENNPETNQPGKLVEKIDCVFNRAVIFDTTQMSWHGLPDPVTCPEGMSRNSIAAYYLCDPPEVVDTRGKALYAPTEDQKGNQDIIDLIQKRANLSSFSQVYKVKE